MRSNNDGIHDSSCGKYWYDLNETGCTIMRYVGNEISVAIPEVIDGHAVTAIGSGISPTFENTKVKAVTLPGSVVTIHNHAFFNFPKLKEIALSPSLTCIGMNAFNGCTSLTEIILFGKLEVIKDGAFANCFSLGSITIPSSTKHVGKSAFLDCKNLSHLVISDGVEEVGATAFAFCPKLKAVELPSSLVTISETAFDDRIDFEFSGPYAEQYIASRRIRSDESKAWEIRRAYDVKDSKDLRKLVDKLLKESPAITELSITYAQRDKRQNTPVDLAPLSELLSLKKLLIRDAGFSIAYMERDPSELPAYVNLLDISALSSLSNLIYLDLSATPVQDLKPLAALLALQRLDLSFTQVVDVSDLLPMTNLVELNLVLCFMLAKVDVSLIQALTKLKQISLPSNLENWKEVEKALRKLGFVHRDYNNFFVRA